MPALESFPTLMETTTITEKQIKALVCLIDFAKSFETEYNHEVVQDCTDLLHKLEFANDGKLRLSGRSRIIEIRHDEDVYGDDAWSAKIQQQQENGD